MKKIAFGTLALLVMVGLAGVLTSAWSQEVTAAIVGTVTDSSGAPIKGATITATDADRGTVWTAQTNDAGAYNLLRLPVGSYSVKVTAVGFQTAVQSAFTLVLNQTARVDMQMKVGKISETVEVSGAAPILQTESTEVSTVIDANTNTSLPLGTRDYLSLTLLAPGATTPNPSEFTTPGLITSSGRPYINGNREQANAMLLDGIDSSENSNNEVGYTPSPDAIQEFNLITQNASAEFGSYEGGVISTTIKSGTNRLHGSAFEFYRDGNFNANSWANGLTLTPTKKPGLVWNQFGGAIGGPILKNKLFFFADYEGQRFDTPPSSANVQVLTNAERTGNFADLCGGGFTGGICNDNGGFYDAVTGLNDAGVANQLVVPLTGGLSPSGTCPTTTADNKPANIPSATTFYATAAQRPTCTGSNPTAIQSNSLTGAGYTENSVASALLGAIPQGNSAGLLPVLNGQQINNDQGDLKIDYKISDKDSLWGRWSQAHIRNPFSSTFFLSSIGPQDQPVRNFGTQWLHTFGTNLLNEARFGFNLVNFDNPSNVAGNVGSLGEKVGITGSNSFITGLPSITAGSFQVGSAGLFQDFHTTTGQFDDIVDYTRGRHQLKLGFQYQRIRLDNVYSGNGGELGQININSLTASPLADLWMGNATSVSRGAIPPKFGRRGNVLGIFAQDDWRMTDTLTLNLGLRFEDHTPFYEIHNQEVNFAGGGLVAGGIQVEQGNHALYSNYLGIGDLLPRIGVSWSPAALHGKTVVRAGYGISAYTEGGGVNQQMTANPPFTGAQYTNNTNTAINNLAGVFANAQITPPCTPSTITDACYKGVGTIRMFDPNFRPALAQQWNLTIQEKINNSTTAQIGYVGQHGTHLYNFMQYTQKPLLDASGNVIKKPGVLGTPGSPVYLTGNPTLLSEISFANGNASNGSQRYDALQAVLQRRLSKGLQAQVAYTYSKCMSDSGGFYGTWGASQTSHGQVGWTSIFAPRMDWGPCFFDETHILTSYVTYQVPVGRGKMFGNNMGRAVDAVVGGWEIGGIVTLHTGNAMSDFQGWGGQSEAYATNGASAEFGGDRTNCNGPVHYTKKYVPATAKHSAYVQFFDSASFSEPTTVTDSKNNFVQGSFGTCSQGGIRGPRYADLDLSLHKAFAISEGKNLEFRAEAYNAFNHPALAAPDLNIQDTGLPSGGFGAITNSQGARQLQLALKFTF